MRAPRPSPAALAPWLAPLLALLLVVVLAPASAARATALPLLARESPPPPDPVLEAALLAASNAARAEHGAPPLAQDEGLARAARAHAEEMARLGYFSHASPMPAHAHLTDRLALAGSPLATTAENLAMLGRPGPAAEAARQALDGWLASPGHRRNLLSADYDRVGFGVARDAGGRLMIVQDFGGDPLSLEDARLAPARRHVTEVRVSLQADRPLRAAVTLGGGGAAPRALPAGASVLELTTEAEHPVQLLVGVELGSGRFVVDDAGWIDPAISRWRSDPSAPRTRLRITSVRVTSTEQAGARLSLRYRPPTDTTLVLFLEGVDRPAARVGPGRFELFVPAMLGVATVEVGESRADGSVRIVHRFHLDAAAASPRLWAGPAPQGDAP